MLNKAIMDLNALSKNVKEIIKRLPKNVKLCAVVKADAYGHGAEKISAHIYKEVDCFAVALIEEGINLRLSGIDKEIIVFTPPFNLLETERAVRYNLTLTTFNLSQINMIEKVAKKLAVSATIHLKYDTGMGRYGVKDKNTLINVLEKLKKSKHVKLCGFYSHLKAPNDKKATDRAVREFLLAKQIVKRYNSKVTFHLSASGGFLKGLYFDMVRIGILLYGYKPFKDESINVKPVMKITAPVIENRLIKKGESAMYGFCTADRELKVALARFGYADGLPREKSGETFNNRCMDVTMYRADKVKIKNGFITVLEDAEKLSKNYRTISYEILTKSALRAEKIYKR